MFVVTEKLNQEKNVIGNLIMDVKVIAKDV